jgi:hypothetical protein
MGTPVGETCMFGPMAAEEEASNGNCMHERANRKLSRYGFPAAAVGAGIIIVAAGELSAGIGWTFIVCGAAIVALTCQQRDGVSGGDRYKTGLQLNKWDKSGARVFLRLSGRRWAERRMLRSKAHRCARRRNV